MSFEPIEQDKVWFRSSFIFHHRMEKCILALKSTSSPGNAMGRVLSAGKAWSPCILSAAVIQLLHKGLVSGEGAEFLQVWYSHVAHSSYSRSQCERCSISADSSPLHFCIEKSVGCICFALRALVWSSRGQGPCTLQASETRWNTEEKKRLDFILLLRFYFYFPEYC